MKIGCTQLAHSASVTSKSIRPANAVPLDLQELFPRAAPLELDLGCGDGSFLVALAAERPDTNFLGIERLVGRASSASRKIAAQRLSNARVLRVDIADAVRSILPAVSVEVCHVMFPDPWPKRRHHRRRTITPDFLHAISRILVRNGLLRLTTDDAPYFEQMQGAVAAVPHFIVVADENVRTLPQSTFQRRFAAAGAPIYGLVLRKGSPET